MPSRQMTLVAFMQAQNCSNYVGSWRHPSSMPDFMSPEYYQRIARTLEDAQVRPGVLRRPPGACRTSTATTIARRSPTASAAVKLDPTIVLMTMAVATPRLGLGSTYSTTYYEPFHVARLFATLDLMTGGPRRLERRHLAQQLGGREFRPRGASRARPALRPRRRVHGGRHRPVGHLGRRRADRRQADRPLRRSRQGPPARPSRQILQVAGAVHRAALGAGPSGADAGRPERPRHGLRRLLGRAGLRLLSVARDRPQELRLPQGRGRRRPAAIRRCSRSRRR